MQIQTNEARIIIAIEAIRTSKNLSCRAAAKIYQVPESTLRDRINGRAPISERRLGASKLTELEEDVIVQNILDMDTRGFAPQLTSVEDMANLILQTRGGQRVRKL
jgi:transposase